MLTAKKVRVWYRIHKWTSLICTAFLLMSCLTGLPMIFDEEIDGLTDHHIKPEALSGDTPFASVDEMVAVGKLQYPDLKVLSVGWDSDEPRLFLNMAPGFDPKPGDEHTLIFDSHTGRLLEKPKRTHDIMEYVSKLHIEIYAGLPGELFLGCMALLFVVALVSGALVYGPFMRKLNFGIVRGNKSQRLKWFDLHNLLGIVTLTWAFVVGATGAMNTLAEPLFGLWRAQEMPHLLAPYRGRPLPTHLGSVDGAIHKVQEAFPEMELTFVVFPNDLFGSPRHYLVWTRGKTPITSRLLTPVLIDVQTSQMVLAKGLPWYLRAIEVSRPLHFGDYGGMPLKIIWAFFDVALIVVLSSGIYLWLSRRKKPLEAELSRLVKLEKLSAKKAPAA